MLNGTKFLDCIPEIEKAANSGTFLSEPEGHLYVLTDLLNLASRNRAFSENDLQVIIDYSSKYNDEAFLNVARTAISLLERYISNKPSHL